MITLENVAIKKCLFHSERGIGYLCTRLIFQNESHSAGFGTVPVMRRLPDVIGPVPSVTLDKRLTVFNFYINHNS